MPIKSKKLFYAEKILRVLGPRWKKKRILLGSLEEEVEAENVFVLEDKSGIVTEVSFVSPNEFNDDYRLYVTKSLVGVDEGVSFVSFERINKVKYAYRLGSLIFESIYHSYFNEMVLGRGGGYVLYTGRLIKDYQEHSLINLAEGKEGEEEVFEI